MEKIKAYIIDDATDTTLAAPYLTRVPSTGDTIRLDFGHSYQVKAIVWCLDEPEYKGGRVNLRVTKVTNP